MNFLKIKNKFISVFINLSKRERILIILGSCCLLLVILYSLTSSIAEVYAAQERKINSLQRNFTTVNISLDRYDKLMARLRSLEQTFKKDGPSDGVRSFLEQAIIAKAKVAQGNFTIRPGAARALGESYSQAPFSINFTTTSIVDLVSFLQYIVQEDSSLLLTRLEVIKGRSAEKLSVTIDVSSITNNQK